MIPRLQFLNAVIDPCCVGRAGSFPRRGAEAVSYGPDGLSDHSIPQLLNTVAHVPVVQVEQVHFPVVTQRPFLMVRPVWRTIEISQLQFIDKVVYVPVVRVEQVS